MVNGQSTLPSNYYPYPHQYPDYPRKDHFAELLGYTKRVLMLRWWILLLMMMAGCLGGVAFVYLSPPKYVSEGRMIVNVKLTIPEGSAYSEELGNFLGTQAALMESPRVIQRAFDHAVAQTGINEKEPPKIKVTIVPRASVFVLQAKGRDPRFVQAFLQACMEEFINLKREMVGRTSDVTLAGMTEEVLRLEKELRQYETELAEFQKSNDIVFLQEQGNAIGAYLAQLNQRITSLKSEYDLLSTLTENAGFLDILTGEQTPLITDQLVGQRAIRIEDSVSAGYLKVKQQLLLLKAEQIDLGQYLRPKHPKMVALAEEISRRERLLEIYKQQGLEQLESRKNSLAIQLKNLEKEAAEANAKALEVNAKMVEYQRIKNNLQRVQALYDRLLGTIQNLDVNLKITPESVTILEDASEAKPARFGIGYHAGFGAAAGLLLGILLIMILERVDDRICSYSDVVNNFSEPLLGQIPNWKSFRTKQDAGEIITLNDDRQAFIEAYRTVRSAIIYQTRNRPIKTILVTSSLPGEGKSVTAANLAIALAMANAKVLLVDADLRKGRLHDWIGVEPTPGLSHVLNGPEQWDTTIVATPYQNLWFMPRGESVLNASELFLSDRCDSFLQQASEQFEFVVFDSVPVLVSDDAGSLGPKIDGVIFVVRSGTTSARLAKAALDQLNVRGAKVLGLVLNALRPTMGGYHYYYRKYRDYFQTAATKS